MREILFRGKRKYGGDWVEGFYYVQRGKYAGDKTFIYEEPKITTGIVETSGAYGETHKDIEYTVIPETVGQYTGLTDKNGKKIFEGDIVKREFTLWHGETKKTRETQIGVVVYSNRDCGFQVEKKCNLRKPWDGDTIEVIGNIHDNPELLKGGE